MSPRLNKSGISLPFVIGISPSLKIRGVIAACDIKKGGIIEKCPIILVERAREEAALKKTVLWKYYYEWNKKYHVIVLGYGSLINHSYTPNARYRFDYKNKQLVYVAIKEIRTGEEILVNYNYKPDSLEPINDAVLDFNRHQPG